MPFNYTDHFVKVLYSYYMIYMPQMNNISTLLQSTFQILYDYRLLHEIFSNDGSNFYCNMRMLHAALHYRPEVWAHTQDSKKN